MSSWPVGLIAVTSTVVCLILWFRDVRRIMRVRKSTVESAARQLDSSRQKAYRARGDPEAEAILERSERIYRQAVELYEQTRQTPWIFLPAVLMGFPPSPETGAKSSFPASQTNKEEQMR